MPNNNSLLKKPIALIIIGIVAVSIIIGGVSIMIFKNYSSGNIGKSVTDIESLSLRMSGMRITEEYEITVNGEKSEISYYNMSYSSGNEEKILINKTTCDTQAVIDALNSFDFVKWNGFSGKHPIGVLDGTMFSLSATINGGQKLSASGSQNFPKHFYEFENWIKEQVAPA